MQEKIQQNVDFILDEVKKRINASKDEDLANFFGVKSGTVSAWRSRNSINYELLLAKCREKEWDLNEIFLGKSTECNNTTNNSKKETNPIMDDSIQNDLIKLIIQKDKEMNRMAEEIGTLKEHIRILKKQKGHTSPSINPEL